MAKRFSCQIITQFIQFELAQYHLKLLEVRQVGKFPKEEL